MMDKVTDEEIMRLLETKEQRESRLAGEGNIIGKRAIDFTLLDQAGLAVRMSDMTRRGPVILAFYPSDFTLVCTQQLCNYRDAIGTFRHLGFNIVGISSNPVDSHAHFAKRYDFPFRLLTDEGNKLAKAYGCSSVWMLGRVSRAVFIVSQTGYILYRYVEPTILTKRSTKELLNVIQDLRRHRLV